MASYRDEGDLDARIQGPGEGMSDHIQWLRRAGGNVLHGAVATKDGPVAACRPRDPGGVWIQGSKRDRCKVCEAVFREYPEMENPE